MSMLRKRATPGLVALLAPLLIGLSVGGCGGSGGDSGAPGNPGMPVGTVVPQFSLPDVNPASGTFGMSVSPSQALGSASAWYFGHST